nr:MAG: putative RNA-dependent RNA polymerase [Botourmiaviridae sp.]
MIDRSFEMCVQVHDRKTFSTLTMSQENRILSSLGELRGVLEQMFDIMLPTPCFTRGDRFLPEVKKFCGGLLESGHCHLWRSSISGLGLRDRFSIAGSLFLFRKVLPSPDPCLSQYMDKMSTPGDPPDPGFLAFVKREVPKIFRVGWDRSYADSVLRFSPSTSSCLESSRKEGGCRGMSARGEWLSRFDAVEFCLSSPVPRDLPPSRVCSVDTGGKKRIISVPSANMNLLRPLHVSMYNHLSRFPWLLRGDAKPSKFRDFSPVEGEVFVSGDYESATDNLNQEVQQVILASILDNCLSVPPGIQEMAMSTLRCGLTDRKQTRIVVQSRGQLMGNLLSFPLLCLVNFLAFKYAVPRNVPLRINGDDIVFRARADEANRWVKEVGRSGLTLSLGKTMLHKTVFSLNSSWFVAHKGKGVCVRIPVIRSTSMGLGVRGDFDSLQGRYRSCAVGFGRRRLDIAHCLFLRRNSGVVHASQRSLTRGLGLRVPLQVLMDSRMWAREAFYLSLESEKPVPPRITDLSWQVKLPGWFRTYGSMTKDDHIAQKEYSGEVIDLVWSTPPVVCDELGKMYRDEVKEGTFAFSTWLEERKASSRRWARLMTARSEGGVLSPSCLRPIRGLSHFKECFKPSAALFYRWSHPVRKTWFFSRDVGRLCRNIKFVAAAN